MQTIWDNMAAVLLAIYLARSLANKSCVMDEGKREGYLGNALSVDECVYSKFSSTQIYLSAPDIFTKPSQYDT